MIPNGTNSKTLFATVSVHIESNSDRLDQRAAPAAASLATLFAHRETLREAAQQAAANAIDSLFNDIAPSDRNSRSEEFLFGDGVAEPVAFALPQRISWTTEGVRTSIDLGSPVQRTLQCRSFWYLHAGNSLSFHLSFELPYDTASLADLYTLSVFQKLIYPTERCAANGTAINDLACLSGETFSQFLRHRFNDGLASLLKLVPGGGSSPPAGDFWSLVHQEVLPEARNLNWPIYRTLFVLRDGDLFEALRRREEVLVKADKPPETIEGRVIAPNEVELDHARVGDQTGTALPYYFMSGFFQNIIDFLNQDGSEIGDGTDAIYPSSEEQASERMFFRFANGRALYQVVAASRSLEVGRPSIGTCPYIFLVHLMVLHNEMITRRYERRGDQLMNQLDQGDAKHEPLAAILEPARSAAARERAGLIQALSDEVDRFRHQAFALYKRYFYSNSFRYDTERDVFDGVTRIRGIENRMAYCDGVVKGINETAQVLETKARYQAQRQTESAKHSLDILLGAITFMTLIQALMGLHDAYGRLFQTVRSPSMPPACYLRLHDPCPNGDWTDVLAIGALIVLVVFIPILIGAFVWLVTNRLIERARLRKGDVT